MIVYVGTATLACWGLNLQFGETGVLNFSLIAFEAIGAYVAAVLTLGSPSGNGGFQHYVFGEHLPFPVPWLAAFAAGAVAGGLLGLLTLRRLRGDYEAVVTLVLSVVATYVVSADTGLFNGTAGLALVPAPFSSQVSAPVESGSYRLLYVGLVVAVCLVAYLGMRRITGSPLGRALRAVRENEQAAAAFGKNVVALRVLVLIVGGGLAALAGAMLVQWIGAWSPSGWDYPETFTLFAAVIIGGRGNAAGVALGALLVPGLLFEGVIFLPPIGPPYLIGALQWIVVGVVLMGFMWFRPKGILPARRRSFPS